MLTVLGIDLSLNQPPNIPLVEMAARNHIEVMVVRLDIAYVGDYAGVQHLERGRDAGIPVRGAYADIYDHDGETAHYDPVRQCKAYLDLLYNHTPPGLVHFSMLDAETAGLNVQEMTAWCDWYDANCHLPLVLYGNMNLENICGANNPRFAKYGLLVADYGNVDLRADRRSAPIPGMSPHVPRVGHLVGWQFAGDNGRLDPYPGAIDLSLWDADWVNWVKGVTADPLMAAVAGAQAARQAVLTALSLLSQ